ncbi:MAG TPA: hypothetical protein VGI39_36280 [Polyangiaceae bacterium]|jgi:hypothetical protein
MKVSAAVVFAAVFAVPLAASAAPPTPRECAEASEEAFSLKKQEQLSAAKERLLLCSDAACPAEVREECAKRLGELNGPPPATTAPGPEAGTTGTSTVAVAPPAPAAAPAAPEQPHRSSWSNQKTLALISGGVGLVGLGTGAGFGALAMSKWSDAKSQCGGGCASDSPAQATKDDAKTAALVSTISFVVGVAGIAGAAVLWFTAPSGAEVQVTPSVSPQSAGLTVRGVF